MIQDFSSLSCDIRGNYLLTGRTRLVTELSGSEDINDILKDINKQTAKEYNFTAAKWLWDYARNVQPILNRVDDSEGASSNNRIVVNYAAAISRNLSAYTFPKGIKYLSRSDNTEYRNFVTVLNKMMMMKSGNAAVQEMKWYQSVCGHAYLYVNYDKDKRRGVPFMIQNVCPWSAYVVYSAFDIYRPVYGVIEYGEKKCIFTSADLYEVDNKNDILKKEVHALGAVPIIEVPNNTMRMGDFEVAITLLNGINSVMSDCVNNVQDVVKSYLVLLGVDPDEVKNKDYAHGSILAFRCPTGTNQSANFIHPSLDGTSVQQLRTSMESALKFVTGIPDRDTENTASSTGVSEDIRTGQSDKDAVANEKTIFVEEAQKQLLEIVFNILKAENEVSIPEGMTAADVDVDITRANRDNILTKSQAMLNFQQAGMCNEDVLYFTNITNDVTGVAERMVNTEEDESDLDVELNGTENTA